MPIRLAQICCVNPIACVDAPACCIANAARATLCVMRTPLGTAWGRMLARMLAAAVLVACTATLSASADNRGMTMPMPTDHAGNHDILITVIAPDAARLDIKDTTELFSLELDAKPGFRRAGLKARIDRLVDINRDLKAKGVRIEHFYDY